jgi:hypothetical protein
MQLTLQIQSDIYRLVSIRSHYYDLQCSYAFEAMLMLKQMPNFKSGIAACLGFDNTFFLPIEIEYLTITPCLGGLQVRLELVSPLQAQTQINERYFVESSPSNILSLLLKEEKLLWQLQSKTTQPVLPFFRQAAQSCANTVVNLLKHLQWGQIFSIEVDQVVWKVDALPTLVSTKQASILPVASGEWGSQFGKHAYAISQNTQGELTFSSDAFYWPVGSQVQWQSKCYAIIAVDLVLTDNSVALGGGVSQEKSGVRTRAVLLEKLLSFFEKKPFMFQGWSIATVEGKEEGSAVSAEGKYRVSMQNDALLKIKGRRSPELLKLHPFMNTEEGLHWPLHAGTSVMTAFCDNDSRPLIVGAILSEHHEPTVTCQNTKSHALSTPGGSHWIVDEEENRLQFGTPIGAERITFEQKNILFEAQESAITQEISTTYTVSSEEELLWQAGTDMSCQIKTEWLSEIENQLIQAHTCHFTSEKSIQWTADGKCGWDIQDLCRIQVKEAHWQADQQLQYECHGAMRLQTRAVTAHVANNLSIGSGGSVIKCNLGAIRFSGGQCILQAPIIQIKPGCTTAILVKP